MIYFGRDCEFYNGDCENSDSNSLLKKAKCEEKSNSESICKFQYCPINKPNVVSSLHCFNCDSIIFSRAIGDIRNCLCKSVCIDGGREQSIIVVEGGAVYETMEFEIFVSNEELVTDWENNNNEFGLIKLNIGNLASL